MARSLSLQQRAALVRMLESAWRVPRGNGWVVQGFTRTLWSLQSRGLVTYLRQGDKTLTGDLVEDPGYELTEAGREMALAERANMTPEVRKFSRR